MNKELTCRDCKHNQTGWLNRKFNMNTWTWTCELSFRQPEYNPVTGETRKGSFESCGVARVMKDVCGPEATAWQPYHKKDLFKYIKVIGYQVDK